MGLRADAGLIMMNNESEVAWLILTLPIVDMRWQIQKGEFDIFATHDPEDR